MFLRDIRSRFRSELGGGYAREEIDTIFHMLTARHLNLPRTILAMEPQLEIGESEALPLLEALRALKDHVPIQYILGRAYFMGMELRVSPSVLIPRPETEELVQWVVRDQVADPPARILDIGTGSGCIAIALKMKLEATEVHAMDLSGTALEVARANADAHQADIRFHQGDICDPGTTWPVFDVLISNPPYVPLKDRSKMKPHVVDAEPHLALFVPDEDPLMAYECICRFGKHRLRRNGLVYLEIHENQGQALIGLLGRSGFADIVLKKDIFGKDRLVRARLAGSGT